MYLPGSDGGADNSAPVGSRWAEPHTLLGLIQRGRGASRAAAQAQRGIAGDCVVDCVVADPRWDQQVEQRNWLYATLLVDLGVEPSRLRAAYARPLDGNGGDSDAWLATGVFGHLARRGVEGSITELRHYLRSGRDIELALHCLLPFVDHPEAEHLLDDVLELADDEQLRSSLGWISDFSEPPWPHWRRTSTRIEQAVTAADLSGPAGDPPVFDSATWDANAREWVLRAAAQSNLTTAVSMSDLTNERWETTLLDVAADMLRDEDQTPGVRSAVRRCLSKLRSSEALAWARAYAAVDGYLGSAALALIADIGEAADAPWLHELLAQAAAQGDTAIYAQCDLVDGLARLGHVASTTTVEEIFDSTVYSYLRSRCAAALSGLSADFADERAIDCLDDCDSRTRAIAIAHVNASVRAVRERIGEMADDPTEDDDNRVAVMKRIGRRCRSSPLPA